MNYAVFRFVRWLTKSSGSRFNNGCFTTYRLHFMGCLMEYVTSGVVETTCVRYNGRILHSHMRPKRAAA